MKSSLSGSQQCNGAQNMMLIAGPRVLPETKLPFVQENTLVSCFRMKGENSSCPRLEGIDENMQSTSRNPPQRDPLMWA